MAESKNNVLTHGLSGSVGGLIVFRQKGGKTFVSSKPRERSGEMSEAQKAHSVRFQEATLYGTSLSEAQKAEYKAAAKDGVSAYNVAVADFLKAPDVEEIDVTAYTGAVGDVIKIKAKDDFKVVEVVVEITNADGSLVESGNAVQGAGKLDWVYTAIAANASLDGDKIVVKASDVPGNLTAKEEKL